MTRLLLVLLVLAGCAVHRPYRHEALHAVPLPTSPLPTVVRPAVPQVSRTLARLPISHTSVSESVWDRLADCESGEWDAHGVPIPGSARWHLNDGSGYQGGLQFVAPSWAGFGGLQFAPRADLASRGQQIVVAVRLQAVQGWAAWPVCSRKVGLR